MSDAPKTAYEIAMEKLKKMDGPSATPETPLTDAQRQAIAQARQEHEIQVAERKIKYQTAISGEFNPSALTEYAAHLRRDLERFEHELEQRIARIRSGD